jgi:hypothetical protein
MIDLEASRANTSLGWRSLLFLLLFICLGVGVTDGCGSCMSVGCAVLLSAPVETLVSSVLRSRSRSGIFVPVHLCQFSVAWFRYFAYDYISDAVLGGYIQVYPPKFWVSYASRACYAATNYCSRAAADSLRFPFCLERCTKLLDRFP